MNYTLTLESLDQRIHIVEVSENLKHLASEYSNPPALPIDIDSSYIRSYNLTHKFREIYVYLSNHQERLIKIDSIQLPNPEPTFLDYVVIGMKKDHSNQYELNVFILNSSNKYLVSKILHIENILNKIKGDLITQNESLDNINSDLYSGNNCISLRLSINESEIKAINTALNKLQNLSEKITEVALNTNKLQILMEQVSDKVSNITLGKLFKNLTWKQIIALASIIMTLGTFSSGIGTYLKHNLPPTLKPLIETLSDS